MADIAFRHHVQMRAARISMFGSILLFLISASVGIAVDSITLILDSSMSLVILLVAFLMNFSLKRTHRPADDYYNFGYTKFEPMTVAVQGVLIIATCAVSIKFAVQDIIHAETLHSWQLPLAATVFGGFLGLGISGYMYRASRKTHSLMLKESGLHWLTDATMSFGMFIGFLLGFISERFGYGHLAPYIDPGMAILLAIFFMFTPVKSIVHNVRELLDAAPGNVRAKAREIIENSRLAQIKLDKLRVRKAGEKIFVQVFFLAHPGLTVSDSAAFASQVEEQLRQHFENCEVMVLFKPDKQAWKDHSLRYNYLQEGPYVQIMRLQKEAEIGL